MAVGRFQVMAVLQAARAYTLGLPLESAYSWGLSRAIFFAAAKRGFKGGGGGSGSKVSGGGVVVRGGGGGGETSGGAGASGRHGRVATGGGTQGLAGPGTDREADREFRLGDELAFKVAGSTDEKPTFMIGGEPQTAAAFAKQIEARFQGSSFQKAWKEALEYVDAFPKETLDSQSRFFEDVYRPRRDDLAEKWSEMSASEGKGAETTMERNGGTRNPRGRARAARNG
jgi:hypothetical protein